MKINTYFIPPVAYDVEIKVPLDEINFGDHTLKLPRMTPEHVLEIISRMREFHEQFKEFSDDYIESKLRQVLKKWQDPNYEKRKISLQLLPKYTNYSEEVLNNFQFKVLERVIPESIDVDTLLKYAKKSLYKFSFWTKENMILKAYGRFQDKLRVRSIKIKRGKHKIMTLMSPPDAIGLLAMYATWIGFENRSGIIIKNPKCQPFFAALFAESIYEVDKELANMIFVLPWYIKNEQIDDVIFKNSDIVLVGLENKLNSKNDFCKFIKKKVKRSIWTTSGIIVSCHGNKMGFDVIGKEYINEDVAMLAVFDGIGYEGRMNPSPCLGIFVEKGGEYTPEDFAQFMAKQAKKISKLIPQSNYYRVNRERDLANIYASHIDKEQIYNEPDYDFTIIYDPNRKIIPTQNRIIRVIPVSHINEVFKLTKEYKKYYQTIGIAISTKRLLNFADRAGEEGISNLRVIGTTLLPRLKEVWDGHLPLLEFYMPNKLHWLSINTINIDEDISKLIKKMNAEIIK